MKAPVMSECLTPASPPQPPIVPPSPLAASEPEGEQSSGSQQKIQGIAKILGRKMEKIINSAFNFSPPISYKCDLI